MRARFTAWADSGLLLIDGAVATPASALQDTGIVFVVPHEIPHIRTGIHIGPVIVEAEALPSSPGAFDEESWEDIAEFTARRVPDEPLIVHGPMEVASPDAPDLDPAGSASVRIRVSAKGLDLNYDLAVLEPSEHYLVQVWPSAADDDGTDGHATSATALGRRGGIVMTDPGAVAF